MYKLDADPSSTTDPSSGAGPSGTSAEDDAGGFACMVQAGLFLDQLFKTLQIANLDTRLIRLDGLDHTMRTFLAIAIDQSQGRLGPFCHTNAIIER